MYTFSQLIDELVAESLRPDQRAVMANGLNQTIRELHFTPEHIPVGFAANLIEEVLVADVEDGFTYALTDPRLFQMMESVWYPTLGAYATMRKPSSMHAFVGEIGGQEFSWYRTGDSIAYSNYGGLDAEIHLAWFSYLPRLRYYGTGETRPAVWNDDTQEFDFAAEYDSTPELQAEALSLTTNWMIQRWWDTLAQGVRAKLYARLADDVRMKQAYSSFEQGRPNLVNAETYDMAPRYRR
jgi:hypothetical protein